MPKEIAKLYDVLHNVYATVELDPSVPFSMRFIGQAPPYDAPTFCHFTKDGRAVTTEPLNRELKGFDYHGFAVWNDED